MSRNIEVRLDQETVVVLQDGRPLRPGARVNLSAAELAVMVRDHTLAGVEAGRQATAALLQATADTAAQAGIQAGAKAGVEAGARYALANSRVRRTVERDADGKIVGSIESREPLPSPPSTEKKPASKQIGFRPR